MSLEMPPIELPVEPPIEVRRRAVKRVGHVGGIMFLLLAIAGARGVQLALAPDPRTLESAGQTRWVETMLQAERGDILDRDGRRLATTASTPNVFVDPAEVPAGQHATAIDALSRILDRPVGEIAAAFSRTAARYVLVARNVHPSQEVAVRQLDIPGIGIERENRRVYPEEAMAASVIGFVDRDGDGKSGLERRFDDALRGGSLVVQRRRDAQGFSVEDPLDLATRRLSRGDDLHLTIDRTLQRATERSLEKAVTTSGAMAGYAVVLDVKTGEVLALANLPTFNPNLPPLDDGGQRNRAVQDAIEPGSIFKPFTVAAGLEAGVIHRDESMDCEMGGWFVGGSRIGDDHPHGVVSLTEVIKYSSNIASAKIGLKLGTKRFVTKLREFGFGAPTGIELPWEDAGRIRNPDKMRTIELATTSFGQGLTTTPIQLAAALATLANGGQTVTPHLVRRVQDPDGVPEHIHRPAPGRQVVSPEVARDVIHMMESVIEPGGTGTRAAVPGYRVAGKTGTAEKVTNGAYNEARISSFVGVIPAEDPVIAIVVSVDEPTIGSRYGGIVAAPVFAEVAAVAMRHLGVAPSVGVAPQVDPANPETPAASATVQGLTWAGTGWRLPDFRALPMREALASLQGSGLGVELAGSGHVAEQLPLPGSILAPGQPITLVLR